MVLIFLGLSNATTVAQGSWTLQTNPSNTEGESIQFVSAIEAWIGLNSSQLLHTTNAGQTWNIITPTDDMVGGMDAPGSRISFINATTGWIMKSSADDNGNFLGTNLYKTTNGGANWTRTILSTNAGDAGIQVQFVDANNGWVLIYNMDTSTPIFKRTTDGGATWIPTNGGGIFHYVNTSVGYSFTASPEGNPPFTISKTTDGGSTWTEQHTDYTLGNLEAIQFIDENNGWIVGYNGKILKTTNGKDWIPITNALPNTDFENSDLSFISSTTGWIATQANADGSSPFMLKTTDGGNSWTSESLPLGNRVFSMDFWDANNGWATSDSYNYDGIDYPGQIAKYSAVNTYPSIGIVGDATSGWETDIVMNTTDGITYTITAYTFKNGGAKFRQDNAWAINWGSNAFPSGTGTQNGPNIPVIAGKYDVTFNRITGAYNFANTANTDWVQQTSETTNSLKSVFFTDDYNGYIVGGGQMGQVILKTTNGGTNWISKNSFTLYTLNSVFSIDANTTYCVGGDGSPNQTLLKTTNGGSNWSTLAGSGVIELKSVFFVDSNIGYAVGGGNNQGQHIILKTINGGTSWVTQTGTTSPNDLTFYSVFFTDANTGYIVGESGIWGTILKTTDGGINWIQQNSGSHSHLNSVFFIDPNVGYIVGDDGVILKTINGGTNYTSQVSGTSRGLSSVYFLNADIGYAVGEFGTILKTVNGGVNWIIQPSGTTFNLNSVYFKNNVGYAVGEGGIILKNNTGALDMKENIINKLITIYPNPNNGTFYFSLKDTNSKVKAEIYTVSGQKVYEASNFEMQPQNEVNFAPQAKGIYLIKITDGKNSYSEKIMIK